MADENSRSADDRLPRGAAELLEAFLDRIGSSEGSVYVGLFRSWRNIVGDRIADHAEPIDIRGTALIVEADHPGWVQMVMMSRQRIIDQLARRFPEIKINGLHVRVRSESTDEPVRSEHAGDSGQEPDATDPAKEEQPPARPISKDENEALANIGDDELRESLAKLRDSLEDKE